MPIRETWFNAEDIRDASEETHCYAISERSLKLCLALLDQINYAGRFEGAVTDDEIDGWQADLAFQLMGQSADCAPEIEPDDPCIEYPPETLFIEYAPNDPFQTPDTIPDGYFVPPWYTNPGIPLPGVLPGDAMVNFLSIAIFGDLPDIVAVGLPRFRITVEGEGEVEIEFVKVPQGGNVLVVIDGNPLEQQVFDLNSLPIGDLSVIEDLFDILVGESLVNTEICEVDFTTAGVHTIDVTFLPNVATDVILGFGGGVRRVSLCGLSEEGVDTNVPEFRVDDCVLQWRPNSGAVWTDLVDLCAVQPPTIVRQDTTPPGNMQQNIGGAGYTDIANTDFVWRNGAYPMVGGLEIENVDSQIALRIQPSASQTGNYSAIEQYNKSGQKLVSWSHVGQFTMFDPGDATRYIQFAQAAGGNGFLTKNGGGQLLIFADSTIVLQYAQQQGVSIGSTSQRTNSMLSVWAKSVSQTAISIVRTSGGTLDLIEVVTHLGAKLFAVTALGAIEVAEIIGLYSQTSTTRRLAATVDGHWSDTTDATRKASFIISVNDYAGVREAVRYSSSGAAAMIGEYGHTPAVQQIVVGDTFSIPALESLIAAIAATGRIIDMTTSEIVIPEPEIPPESDTWCLYYDFSDHESWELDTTYAADHIGQYVAGVGWVDEDSDPAPAQVVIRKDFGLPYVITGIEITFTFFTSDPEEPPLEPYAGIFYGSIDALYKEQFYGAGGSYTLSHTSTVNTRYLQINVTDNSYGAINLVTAKIFGAGAMPTDATADTCP